MCAVGEDAHLRAGVALGLEAEVFQRHAEQGDGDLFAGGDHHIQFTRVRVLLDLFGQGDQAVGFARHGGHHHDHLVALGLVLGDAFGDRAYALDAADRSAAIFLNDQ